MIPSQRLQKDVDDYIDFYNHRRFHETLDYKKPIKVYQENMLFNNRLGLAA
jgi:putative transposase